MLRSILAVVLGYLTMAVLVMLAFSLALVAPEFAFRSGELDVTPGFLAYSLVASAIAAAAAGAVAAGVGRGPKPVWFLAALVLAFGLVEAARNAGKPIPTFSREQAATMSVAEKAQAGVQPGWYAFLLPWLGAAGVLAGGMAVRQCRRRSDVATV